MSVVFSPSNAEEGVADELSTSPAADAADVIGRLRWIRFQRRRLLTDAVLRDLCMITANPARASIRHLALHVCMCFGDRKVKGQCHKESNLLCLALKGDRF